MDPILAQWLPVMVMLLAIMLGVLFNNKRLDDFKDLFRSEVGRSKAELHTDLGQVKMELQADVARSEQRILQAIADLKVELQALGRRVEKLEAPLVRPS